MITLNIVDLAIAASLVLMLALLSLRMQVHISRQLLVAALRTAIQLTLIGLVLKALFANVHLAPGTPLYGLVGLCGGYRFHVPVLVCGDGVRPDRDPG
jgi:ABC-type iron transport system FetAB permease component